MSEVKRYAGQVALVTGAGQGLGEALAHRMAREGADVVVADILDDKAAAVAEAITTQHGVRAIAVHADVTDAAQCDAMVDRAVAEFGRLDVCVSNAGILMSGAITEFDPARWRKVIEVNLVGYFNVARAAARVMIAQKSGNIVQINSKSGKKGSSKNSAYAASKFGGIGLTQSLALELAEHNIRVNAICPGDVDGERIRRVIALEAETRSLSEDEVVAERVAAVSLRTMVTADDVAELIMFVCSAAGAKISGQALLVDGNAERA